MDWQLSPVMGNPLYKDMLMSFDVICTDFVMSADKQQFVTGLKEYGLTPLEASKIYAYLLKKEREKPQPHDGPCRTPSTNVEFHDV